MKKQLLLAFAFMATAIGVNAQDSKVWNFSTFKTGDISETTTVDGLTVYATDSYRFNIDLNDKKYDGVAYTQRLKSQGISRFAEDGSPVSRVLEFEVSSKGTVNFGAISSSSKATERYLRFVVAGETVYSYNAPGSQGATGTFNYEGEAGTMQVIYVDEADVSDDEKGGVNLYFLSWTDLSDGTDPTPGPGDEETTEWSFNSEDYLVDGKESGVTISAGEYAIANGMTIIASEDGKVKLEINKSIADGAPSKIATRGALNTGGSRNGFSISDVKAGDRIQFAMAATGEVKEGELRGVDVSENNTDAFESFRLEVGDLGSYPRDFEYTVKSDGVVKFLSERAVVFYNVILISDGGSEPPVNSIDDTNVEKEIVATEYYSINGIRLAAPVKGINIVKNLMDDGSVETSKVYIK